ncbi:phage tail tape measure C-terminal domain-containing protein [uncultured Hyphomonas sp.]|uniref:phage tail tape measure C-terminal domain-containing protein n=1 Tax=uncultured Hyphomonas sp. TaxID=225298 RepID=UPI0030DDD6AF|tara:strand:+ start:1820 stop:2200 length:381 start_codon:yes stop_codon:yes gene_type:complete
MMTDFENDLTTAGDALRSLAEGPGVQAAEALEAAFGRAGQSIEIALGQAARSGELDFERMAESILKDLARVAAESVAAMAGAQSGAQQAVTLNMNYAPGAEPSGRESEAAMSAMLARLVAGGGRFL